MIAAMMAMAAQASAPATPPADWNTLAELRLRPRAASAFDPAAFVKTEVGAGRCAAEATAPASPRTLHVSAPVAVLLGPDMTVRQIVPRAIGCPTVEQYTVGYVSTLARGAAVLGDAPAPGWYRLTIRYEWPE